MPQLTPALPPRYRRRALAALGGLMTRAEGDVAGHLATVGRLAAAGEDSTAARARLGPAEYGSATPLSCYAVDDRSVRCAELTQQCERSCIIASF